MAATVRYFITGIGADLIDLHSPTNDYSLLGETVSVFGNTLVNTIYAAPGVDLDARN